MLLVTLAPRVVACALCAAAGTLHAVGLSTPSENVCPQELAEEHEGELRAQEALKKSSGTGPAQV